VSAFSPYDAERVVELLEQLAADLGALRRELERQTTVLDRMLDRLHGIERTQHS